MDDVCTDFCRHILDCWYREYGVVVPYENINGWKVMFDGTLGPTWKWLEKRDWLWAKTPATAGAIGGIQRLRDEGHYLEILTSKPTWAEWVVWAWAGKWRPAVNRITIVPSHTPKHEASTADVLVDDAVHNVNPWVTKGRFALLYDKPWNQEGAFTAAPKLIRVKNWTDVVTWCDYLADPDEGDSHYREDVA